ncbi:hypothetical protein EST38_g3869 [Candolleomyces aberdarensis]|uniref:NACHT domain-containing protein n=1 Tax=Candolleomyces aberdarensis TaxID=2316362 RepID=A0A4V1Q4G2_9AGAR|nr:hypothetical protein EST38_g3869 [Candolleomyces aberdarensis]
MILALQYLHEHAATGAAHDSEERSPPPSCHPGTRQAVLGRITGWYSGADAPPKKPIMWVHGPAGYGKTAVAQTISDDMEVQQQELDFNPLGGTFFFWRTSPERNNPSRFVITLAYQLATAVPDLSPHIERAVKCNRMIVNKTLEMQLTKLIIEPFRSLKNVDKIPRRLLIIDGLDECINSDQTPQVEGRYLEGQERTQRRVLDLIHTLHSHKFPLSFLILSRPEAWIKQYMESDRFKFITETVDLYEMGDHHDVEIFLRAELNRISDDIPKHQLGKDEEKWPSERSVRELLRRAGGHMLYAAIVIRHIDDPYDDRRRLLEDILASPSTNSPSINSPSINSPSINSPSTNSLPHSVPFAALHDLYRQIMLSCPAAKRPLMLEVLEEILIFVDPTDRPITTTLPSALQILDPLSGRASGEAGRALRCLHAVVRQDGGGQNNFFIHSSFPDFLVNSKATSEFAIDLRKARRRLLSKCFECMTSINSISSPSSVEGGEQLEAHLQHALKIWPYYWYCWDPLDEAEYVTQLNMLYTINLSACLVRANVVPPHYYIFARRLYDCRILTPNPVIPSAVDSAAAQYTSNPTQPTASLPAQQSPSQYMQSSVEEAFLYMLDPFRVQIFAPALSYMLFYYLWSCWSGGDKWDLQKDKAAKAWMSLKKTHPHLYQLLSWESLFEPWSEYYEFMKWVNALSFKEEN